MNKLQMNKLQTRYAEQQEVLRLDAAKMQAELEEQQKPPLSLEEQAAVDMTSAFYLVGWLLMNDKQREQLEFTLTPEHRRIAAELLTDEDALEVIERARTANMEAKQLVKKARKRDKRDRAPIPLWRKLIAPPLNAYTAGEYELKALKLAQVVNDTATKKIYELVEPKTDIQNSMTNLMLSQMVDQEIT